MPEVLGNPPSPRTALFWNETEWQWALVDAAGHLQTDVIASGLPLGAATAAAQALALAQLQLIEDMRDALQSVATDRLIVRGEDQLFSLHIPLIYRVELVISGANGWVETGSPGAGLIWVLTAIGARNRTSPVTGVEFYARRAAVDYGFHARIAAIAQWEFVTWSGHVYLTENDNIRAVFPGALAGDTCEINLLGYEMTVEA